MLISTLATLVPLLLAANALPFESPSSRSIPDELAKRDPAPGTNWVKLGCYVDTVTPRTLSASQTVSDTSMTNAYCQQYCGSRGYSIAGTEWSKECFCDNTINNSLLADDAGCDMTCTGGSEVCGGGARITVWQNQGTVTAPGRETVGEWTWQGCFVDSTANRALPTQVYVDGGMTVEKCTAKCLERSFKYAGVEYGSECFCADVIGEVGTSANDGCDMACSGNPLEACGGGNRLNIYSRAETPGTLPAAPIQVQQVGDWTLQGCYSDDVNARSLPIRQYVDGGMTAEKCTAKCFSLNFGFAGVEFGNECYCSGSIAETATSGTVQTGGCDMPCDGASATEICGGGDRLTLYKYTGSALGTGPTVLDAYETFKSKGCYVDSVDSRALTTINTAVTPLTVGNCVQACTVAGYTVAGLEYSSECYCGNALPAVAATDGCVMKCDGDSHVCGGPNRLSVYQKEEATEPTEPTEPVEPTEPTEPTVPTVTRGRIVVKRVNDDTVLGYLAQPRLTGWNIRLTSDASAATWFEKEEPATLGGPFNIKKIGTGTVEGTGVDVNHPYLGTYDYGRATYWGIDTVGKTAPGVPFQLVGSSIAPSKGVESCIWTEDPLTNKLSQIFVKSEADSFPVAQFYYGNPTTNSGDFYSAVDTATISAIVINPSVVVPIKFYLERFTVPVTPPAA